jgi:hypothetical protein
MTNPIPRREATRLLLLLAASPLIACGRQLECTDTSDLSPADRELRGRTLRYTDTSPNPKEACRGCQQFKPRGENECGGCVVVRGPVNPGGRCSKWAGKPT